MKIADPYFRLDAVGRAVVVRLLVCDVAEMLHASTMFNEVVDWMNEHDPERVVVEMSKLEVLSSALLGRLVVLHRRAVYMGGKLVLCGLSRKLRDTFHLCRLDKLFDIRETLEEALGE